jgi:predicted transcriptional regulator of viral defense system
MQDCAQLVHAKLTHDFWIKIQTFIIICWYIYPMTNRTTDKQIKAAKQIFRRHGGVMRTGEATTQGVHCRTLYAMRDAGILERLDRGLYRLADLPPLSDPDLVTVARKIPRGVICLISALHYHDITTQIPHAVSIAVSRGTEPPRLNFPPIQLHWFSGEAFIAGVEEHTIENTTVRVYSAEKTLADCFKYRNKIGMDTVLEALTLYRENRKTKPRKLLQFAKACRVEKVMRPYLEALL